MGRLFSSFRYVMTRILRCVPYQLTYICFKIWMMCTKRGFATGGGERWAASDWDEIASVREVHHVEHTHRYVWVTSMVRDERVLDLGCGTGYGSYYMSFSAREVVGIDIAGEAIEWAKENFHRPNIVFEVGNAAALRFKDKEFDHVICFEVIEHVRDPESVLKEIRRVCKGKLIISTPIADRESFRIRGLIQRRRLDRYPFHVREYTIEEFKEVLGKHFKQVEMYGQYAKGTETFKDWLELEKRSVGIGDIEMSKDKLLKCECMVAVCE